MRTDEKWIATYYIANRWGSTQEKIYMMPGDIDRRQAQARMETFIRRMQDSGRAVYPQFDLEYAIPA